MQSHASSRQSRTPKYRAVPGRRRHINNQQSTQRHASSPVSPPPKQLDTVPDKKLKSFVKAHNLDKSLYEAMKDYKFSQEMFKKLTDCAIYMPKPAVTSPNILTLCEVVPHIMDLPIYDADMLMQALSSVKVQPAEPAAQALLRQISKSSPSVHVFDSSQNSPSVRVLDQAQLCQSVQNAILELTSNLCPLLSTPQLKTIGTALDNLLHPLFTHIKDTDKSPVAVVDYLSTHHGLVLNLDQKITWAGRALSDFSQCGDSTLVLNDWPDSDRLPKANTLSIESFSDSTLVLPVGNAILLAALFHTMITNRVTTDDDVSRLFAVLGWTDADRARFLCSHAFTIVSSLQGQSTFNFINEHTPSLTISGPPGTGKSQLYLIFFSLLVNAKIDVTLISPAQFLHHYIRVANGILTVDTNKLSTSTFPLHNNIVLFDIHDEQYMEHAPFIEGLLSSRQVGLVVALRSSQVTAAPKRNSGLKDPYCPVSLSLPCYLSRFNIMHLYAQQMYALQSPDNDPNSDTVIQQATALVKKVIRAYMSRFGNSLFYIDSTSTQSCKNALGTDPYSIQPFPDSLTHAEKQLLSPMLYCNPTIRTNQAFFASRQPPRSASAIAKMRHVIVAHSDDGKLPCRHVLYPPLMLAETSAVLDSKSSHGTEEEARVIRQILLNDGLAVWLPLYNVQVSECFFILNGEELDTSLFPVQSSPSPRMTQTKLSNPSSITTHAAKPLLGVEYWPEAFALNGDALRELERLAIGQEILGSVSVAMIQGARADFVTKNPVNSGVSSTKKPSGKKGAKHKKKKNSQGPVSQPVANNKKTQLSVMMGEAVEAINWSALDMDEHRYYKLVTAQGKLAEDCLFCLTQGLKQTLLVVVALAVVHRPKLHMKLVLCQRTVSKWAVRLKKISIGETNSANYVLNFISQLTIPELNLPGRILTFCPVLTDSLQYLSNL